MNHPTVVSFVSFVAIMLNAIPVRAELVFFSSGRSLSVKGHHGDGDSLVLTLRGGGEIICAPSMIARIEPDEVPYPEPEDVQPGEVRPKSDATDATYASLSGDRLQRDLQLDPRYDQIIEKAAAAHGVDAALVRALIQVESNYESRARSPKGAMGLMQLMPATARHYAVRDPYDPVSNIEAGIRHLKSLLERFPLALALAAYNAGEASVQRFRGVPPYQETRSYVDKILRLAGGS